MISSEYALLIIDMQQGLFRGPVSPYLADSVLSNICLLIEKARQAKVPVFFARHTGPEDSCLSEQSPLTQLIPEMDVNAGHDVIFIKKHPNCFQDTNLQQLLHQQQSRNLIIAGMKTEFCVNATCRAAVALGFRTVLISDAHTTMDNDHLSAREIINRHHVALDPIVSLVKAADWACQMNE